MPNIAALITVAAVMFAVLGAITLIAHIYNLNNIKSKTVGDGQHGTARWANKAEIRKTYRHIPFTPKKWRKQAKQNQTPTMTATAPRKLLRKKTEPTEEALPQGIVVGCKGGKHSTTAMIDTGDVHLFCASVKRHWASAKQKGLLHRQPFPAVWLCFLPSKIYKVQIQPARQFCSWRFSDNLRQFSASSSLYRG